MFSVGGTTTLVKVKGWGVQANALVDMSPDSDTFVGTLNGVTPSVTGTLTCRRMGAFATIYGSLLGTSNANTCTITGLPTVWQPVIDAVVPVGNLEDNSVNCEGQARLSPSSGTITFFVGALVGTRLTHITNGFTASGQKGINLTQIGPYAVA